LGLGERVKEKTMIKANGGEVLGEAAPQLRYLARAKGRNIGSGEKYKKGVGLKTMSLV
jgi:hypothetical protein